MQINFSGKTEAEARAEILNTVAEYHRLYHADHEASVNRIPYAGRVYDDAEMVNLVDSALDFWLTAGRYADRFEKEFAEFLGVGFCSLVNSGSSANLLAFMALTSPLLGERRIKPGDEVVTVAAGFPTTVSPVLQYGAVPVFIDITIPEYNADVSMLQSALTKKTKAVMLAHTLGNPFDLRTVKRFCDDNSLWLIEDNCDALGSKYLVDGVWKYTGTVGDIGTSSFYPPHHMTMGEGGAVYTDNPLLDKIVKSLRDWGRDCGCPPGVDNLCGHRFDRRYGELPDGYDHKYVYSHLGYNLKATDMQAAVGVAQLAKLPGFIEKRKQNFDFLKQGSADLEDVLILPEAAAFSEPSWFGFMLTVKTSGTSAALVEYLESAGIQTRRLFAGNLIKHPCFDEIRPFEGERYRVAIALANTDRVMNDSFWIGVFPGMTDEMLEKMIRTIKQFYGR